MKMRGKSRGAVSPGLVLRHPQRVRTLRRNTPCLRPGAVAFVLLFDLSRVALPI